MTHLRFVNSLRTEVSAIDSFPDRADPAVVRELHRSDPVTSVAISGELPLGELDLYADALSDRLTALPGVARVTRGGLGARTLSITPDRAVLDSHGLTPAALAAAIAAQNIDLPAGTLEGPGADLTLRFTAERDTAITLATIPVLVLPNGATLTLGDVAVIEERFEPPQDRAFVDGTPAIVIDVAKSLDADALRVLDGGRGAGGRRGRTPARHDHGRGAAGRYIHHPRPAGDVGAERGNRPCAGRRCHEPVLPPRFRNLGCDGPARGLCWGLRLDGADRAQPEHDDAGGAFDGDRDRYGRLLSHSIVSRRIPLRCMPPRVPLWTPWRQALPP